MTALHPIHVCVDSDVSPAHAMWQQGCSGWGACALLAGVAWLSLSMQAWQQLRCSRQHSLVPCQPRQSASCSERLQMRVSCCKG